MSLIAESSLHWQVEIEVFPPSATPFPDLVFAKCKEPSLLLKITTEILNSSIRRQQPRA